MSYPRKVNHARTTFAILAVGGFAMVAVAGCSKLRKPGRDAGATASTVDPVQVAEMASAAPSASAGFEAFHKAYTLHDTACSGGDYSQCVSLGIDYETGRGVDKDVSKAAPLYDSGCTHGVMTGCANLGQLLDRGAGVPKDPVKAAGLYKKACDGGESLGCYDLG